MIASVLALNLEGSRQGKSELMRPAFHPEASFIGYAGVPLAVVYLDVAGSGGADDG